MATLPSGSGIERTPVTAHASSTAIASKIVSRIRDPAATGPKAVRGVAESEAIEGFVRWPPSGADGSLTKTKPLARMASINQSRTSEDFR